eukprot:TRINITY_DN8935_c0_g1_i1.p2 TRINITY_DN8935_c0_g1~~TRINITY_DN8935_c0_g1_i1.p2  ORF type:complete len:277 (+),score=78.70 TRINITY_DN8935_c0_g1_i1:814-1644(+)
MLITHPELVVRQEADLYKFIVRYLECAGEALSEESRLQLLQGIQFADLSSSELTEASAHALIPQELVLAGMLQRLQHLEGQSEAQGRSARHRVQQHARFVYESDMDTNGILHHLGTLEGTQEYSNPAAIGQVRVHSGKMCYGDINNLVGRVGSDVWTDDDPAETWYLLDLGPQRTVQLTAYTLRRGGGASRARDWVLEGAEAEGAEWQPLYEHGDDRRLEGTDDDYGTCTWEIEQSGHRLVSYSRFRLRMTKPAHDGDWYFAVSGVELYGSLITSC